MELELNDKEAQRLIKMLKQAFQKYNIQLKETDHGEIKFVGFGGVKNGEFKLIYKCSPENKVFQFMECKYYYTLFRINLNSNFHKNADGTRVYGNRINIFSEEEFIEKGDGHTYCRSYALPFENIQNSTDFLEIFSDILKYANIMAKDEINISIQSNLV